MKRYVLSAAFALVLGLAACTDSDPQSPEPKQQKAPANAPASPGSNEPEPRPVEKAPEPAPPSDNCGLAPADMDHKTKVQCGIATEEVPAPEEPMPGCGPGTILVPESPIGPYCDGGGPATGAGSMSFTEQCAKGVLGVEDGCASAFTPEDDGAGSLDSNPNPSIDCQGMPDGSTHCQGGSPQKNEQAEQEGDATYQEFCNSLPEGSRPPDCG